MSLTIIDGENERDYESVADKIERLEARIEELETDLSNMTEEKDIQYDRAENLEKELEELRPLKEDFDKGELIYASDDDKRALEIVAEIKSCYERLGMGVNTEIDQIIKLTNELMELYTQEN